MEDGGGEGIVSKVSSDGLSLPTGDSILMSRVSVLALLTKYRKTAVISNFRRIKLLKKT